MVKHHKKKELTPEQEYVKECEAVFGHLHRQQTWLEAIDMYKDLVVDDKAALLVTSATVAPNPTPEDYCLLPSQTPPCACVGQDEFPEQGVPQAGGGAIERCQR
jgi:hypothetical protein